MRALMTFLTFFLMHFGAFAQDEKYFRELFSGDLVKEVKEVHQKNYSFKFHTPMYLIDILGDGKKQGIMGVKKDGEDWLEIYDTNREKIFSYQFTSVAANGQLYRVVKHQLDSQTTLMLLYYFEGIVDYLSTAGSARLYFLTIDNRDLKKISVYKGPSIYEEVKTSKGHYHLRNYKIRINEYNQKEVLISYKDINRAYLYRGNGNWITTH
jgi:hypothetical protein